MNSSSRLMWLGAALNAFKALKPSGPFYAVTVISAAWNRSTADEGSGTAEVKKTLEELLDGLEADSLGHVETAVFPKTRLDNGGCRAAPHAQVIVYGVSENALRKALKAAFPPLEDGTKGYWVLEITDGFGYALSYATKSPSYGYSDWPMGDGSRTHKSVKLPQGVHLQLLKQFHGVTWLDVNIATGEGKKIRQRAITEIGFKPVKTSPLADNSTASATEKPPVLTLETGVDPSLKVDMGKRKLLSMAAAVSVGFDKSLKHEAEGEESLSDSLATAYELALASADQEGDLKKLLKLKGITFNRAADLFLLAVKVGCTKKNVDKRRQSEWAGALRYMYGKKCKPTEVATKLKEYGGPSACVKAMKRHKPSNDNTPELTQDEIWDTIKAHGEGFEVATNKLDMPLSKGVLVAARNKDGNRLLVRHVVGIEQKRGKEFVQKVANDLTAKSAKTKKASN